MIESALTSLAVSLPELAGLYWVCLIVGGGLLAISTIAGSHADADVGLDADVDVDMQVDADLDMDVDADVDVEADVSADADVDAAHAHVGSLTTWFSIRFVVFFMAMFGVVGVTLTYLTDWTSGVVLAYAMLGGLTVGQGVHQFMRKLRRTSCDSTPKRTDYIGKLARVTIAITSEKKGEITLRVGRADRYISAIARHAHDTFAPNHQVGVVAYHDGVAEVVSRKEFEFLTDEDSKEDTIEGEQP